MPAKTARAAMMLWCLAALPGCEAARQSVGELSFPAVVDFAEVRCPPVDAVTHNEWRRTTTRPTDWGKPDATGKLRGATRGELEDLVDKHEISEARKNYAGQRLEA